MPKKRKVIARPFTGNQEADERAAYFYRLFYRTELWLLIQRIDANWHATPEELRAAIKALIDKAENDDLCQENSKGMYFCNRKLGHKGKHRDWNNLVWD